MKRKSAFIIIISVVLAAIFAAQPTAKAASEAAENNKEYISEMKIGVGKTEEEAASSLDGYTILSDNGKNVDLNQSAGGGIGSKGDRVVYLGYKTTSERSEAITDLAVMNMKGGYSVKDYELLMEQYMTEQIIPFVDDFLAAIREYRENYTSEFPANKARAQYVHDALNKLTDDDCGGKGLGDLLLNETKYEMGDAAYEALSEDEKKQHADILTIISQANGKATVMMESLITRAADTGEDTWVDRFVNTTYEDLLELYRYMLPSDAEKAVANEFDDDARKILSMWSDLKERIDDYSENVAELEELLTEDHSAEQSIIDHYDFENATEEQTQAYVAAFAEVSAYVNIFNNLYADVAVKEYLDSIEYRGGTLTDFFSKRYKVVEADVTVLYPLVASLSEGQRAGLEFVTLPELIMLSATDLEGYKDAKFDEFAEVSVYNDVDREIYKKGGVALTSEALRSRAAEEIAADGNILSNLTCLMIGASAVSAIAFGSTLIVRNVCSKAFNNSSKIVTPMRNHAASMQKQIREAASMGKELKAEELKVEFVDYVRDNHLVDRRLNYHRLQGKTPICTKLMIGFGVAMVVFSAAALYLSYRDLVDYYNVDYTPIPNYIVDEKDITAYNEKGEKTVIKNQAAYYKVVECNRDENDEWYGTLGTSADLNGTVGRQWLALYTSKNENESPIIASSLKVVVGSDKVPADYTTGIHMFGSESAYNLNNTQFVWNNEAKSVYVYFNVDTSASGSLTTGSSFTAGYIILAAAGGLIVGAAAAAVATLAVKKKKAEA